jgi:hypothetical protein
MFEKFIHINDVHLFYTFLSIKVCVTTFISYILNSIVVFPGSFYITEKYINKTKTKTTKL